jgi:hypothetical protein
MHITGEVSLGTILTIATLLGIAIRFGFRFGHFDTTLRAHTDNLARHAARMDRYEERYVQIANNLQRIIGRMEEQDRSPWPRNRRANP